LGDEDGGKSLRNKAEDLMSKKELTNKINQKKAELAPILKELKSIREDIDVKKNHFYADNFF
jgi:hypothetical protein